MASFDEAWLAVANSRKGEAVSSELRPFLQEVYKQTLCHQLNTAALKQALADLLQYLAGPGRANANCRATDIFFSIGDGWETGWEAQELPGDFHDIFVSMGEALHDTVEDPAIAGNFGCLPEQLLGLVQKLVVD